MNYIEAIEPVTNLKSKSAELVRRARETGQPIIITQNGKATAVLQDVETYQRQRQAPVDRGLIHRNQAKLFS